MQSSRKDQAVAFRQDILAGRRGCDDTLFRVLYGISVDVQIELARYMTARYLPIFRSHRADLPWVENLLADVETFFSATDGGLPEPPSDDLLQGDISFTTCLSLLGRAWSHAKQNRMGRLTAACGAILIYAVAARAANVWRADDPEAVRAFETNDTDGWVGRTSHDNVASQAVRRREWLLVADWLDAHDIGSFPDTPDGEVGEREEALAAWRDREYLF